MEPQEIQPEEPINPAQTPEPVTPQIPVVDPSSMTPDGFINNPLPKKPIIAAIILILVFLVLPIIVYLGLRNMGASTNSSTVVTTTKPTNAPTKGSVKETMPNSCPTKLVCNNIMLPAGCKFLPVKNPCQCPTSYVCPEKTTN